MSTPVVLITGALTGIGRATALAFAHEAARIVVSGRRDEAGNALAIELRTLGVEAEFVRADVRHEDDLREAATLEPASAYAHGRLAEALRAVEKTTRQKKNCAGLSPKALQYPAPQEYFRK
jgi:NAD(P)-dependent dehydrogenase (short-subunit alcohol dehydrogenase family)